MPEVRYYIVQQTREVKVWANKIEDAVIIASREMAGQPSNELPGAVTSKVRVTNVTVNEDR